MSSFYTSVHKYGNNILFRGYDSKGNRIHERVKFKPTMFLPSKNSDSGWKALDGSVVEPRQFNSMKDAFEFSQRYEGVENFTIHGNTNFASQFILEKYPDIIDYDYRKIRIGNIDIEVASDEGFPRPEEANYPVISIAYRDSVNNIFNVWGMGDYDYTKCELELNGAMIRYVKCRSEGELLQKFMIFWENNYPDIITGWNVRLFDIPYLINRTTKICGEKTTKAISPWGIYQYRQITIMKKRLDAYEIYGVMQMDYMDLFQKFGFSYGNQESYSLDHISHVVLGESKLSYEDNHNLFKLLSSSEHVQYDSERPIQELPKFQQWARIRDKLRAEKLTRSKDSSLSCSFREDTLPLLDYTATEVDDLDLSTLTDGEVNRLLKHGEARADQEAYQLGIDYNIRDVDLVDRIDQQTGLMELALVIAYKGGVNYPDAFGTTGIWDSITYRYLAARNIAVPPNINKDRMDYGGGYVKDPRVGMVGWLASFDLNSLYPNLIVQYNMSPETLLRSVQQESGVDHYLDHPADPDAKERNFSVAANGSCYTKSKRGMLPDIIIKLYDERRLIKDGMLEAQSEYELLEQELKELEMGVLHDG